LPACRELEDAVGLTGLTGGVLSDSPRGGNIPHLLTGPLRQSAFGRLAGCEDVNDAERLTDNSAMRAAAHRGGLDRQAAPSSRMRASGTAWLTTNAKLAARADLSVAWIDRVLARRPQSTIVPDMDSSVTETHDAQQGSRCDGHFACTCCHPLLVFNQLGDLERCALRPRNVHGADGGRDIPEPVAARYDSRLKPRHFRGDAVYVNPEIHEYLEAKGCKYAIRLFADPVLQESIAWLHLEVGRPPRKSRRCHASFGHRAEWRTKPRPVVAKPEWHPGGFHPHIGFIVTNMMRPAK
jgi:Transposase DDE domain group 1